MNYEYEINQLNKRLNNLQNAFLQSQRNNAEKTAKADDTANKVVSLTPYTDTDTAYIGDTQVLFVDAPQGNVSVYFSNYNGGYSTERIGNGLCVFIDEPLEEVTEVTISIS